MIEEINVLEPKRRDIDFRVRATHLEYMAWVKECYPALLIKREGRRLELSHKNQLHRGELTLTDEGGGILHVAGYYSAPRSAAFAESFEDDSRTRFPVDLSRQDNAHAGKLPGRLPDHILILDEAVLAGQKRRRGPKGYTDEQKLRFVRNWLAVQHDTLQDIFCADQNISPSALREWIAKYETGELAAK
ncbi:MAG: transposase [Chloroflexi bacterium]|nr:transposase [Chloroflexota bacterium]